MVPRRFRTNATFREKARWSVRRFGRIRAYLPFQPAEFWRIQLPADHDIAWAEVAEHGGRLR